MNTPPAAREPRVVLENPAAPCLHGRSIDEASERFRRLSCSLAGVAGLSLTALVFYPGIMNVDASLQLQEARGSTFSNWHPPLMSWVWSFLDRIASGSVGMFFLHNLMFWSGTALVVYLSRFSSLASVALILGTGLFPPIFSSLGTVWKDVGMFSAFLIAYGFLLYGHRTFSVSALILAAPFLLYGFAVRHNALPAALPLCVWAGMLAYRNLSPSKHYSPASLLVGVLLFVSMGAMIQVLNRLLIDGNELYPSQQVFLHDLTGVSVRINEVRVPDSLISDGDVVSVENIACIYTPDTSQTIFNARHGDCSLRYMKITDDTRLTDLRGTWFKSVPTNLGPYIEHRVAVFRSLFGINKDRVCYPLEVGGEEESFGIEVNGLSLNEVTARGLAFAAYRTPLYRGWFYLCLIGVVMLLGLWLRRGDRTPALVLGLSGLLYALAYLVIGTTCVFRMHGWLVVATLASIVVTLGRSEAIHERSKGR